MIAQQMIEHLCIFVQNKWNSGVICNDSHNKRMKIGCEIPGGIEER